MQKIGTFKPEFEAPVKRYAELSIQYEILNDKWYENGCEITENGALYGTGKSEKRADGYGECFWADSKRAAADQGERT